MAHDHADVTKHVKAYMYVFGALAGFTILTVAASRLPTATGAGIAIALLIAATKASLVAAIFMHLKWERSKTIWYSLALCGVFFIALMALPVLVTNDHPVQTHAGTWTQLTYHETPATDHATDH
ncbi:MAG: cytochrome C oxidase subunit IV family protein [Phycisphaerae bacterium]